MRRVRRIKRAYRKKLTVISLTDKKKSEDFYKLFKPQLTPQKMLEMGVFGGSYFGVKIKEYPKSWFKNAKLSKIFDIEDANYIPKPSKESLDCFIKKFNINPSEAIFFEDISKNLINAKKLGFQTILIKSNSHPDINTNIIKEESVNSQFIDYASYNLPSTLEEIYLDINN